MLRRMTENMDQNLQHFNEEVLKVNNQKSSVSGKARQKQKRHLHKGMQEAEAPTRRLAV